MIEDAFTGAASTLNQTVLGAVLILGIIGYIITVKILRDDLKSTQGELLKEREDHQKTRDAQMADIRNLAHVASSVEGLKTSFDRFIELSSMRGGR